MSTKCAKCQNVMIHDEVDSFQCTECKGKFHFYCAGYCENDFKRIPGDSKMKFACSGCKKLDTVSKIKTRDEKTAISDATFEELVASDNFVGNQLDFNDRVDFVLKEIKDLKAENSKILSENGMLNEQIIIMKQKLNDLSSTASIIFYLL